MSTEAPPIATTEAPIDPSLLESSARAAFKHAKFPAAADLQPIITREPEPKVVVAGESKPDATKKEDPQPPPAVPPEKRHGDIKQLREAHESAVKEAKELKGQLAEFEGTRKERDELKTRIATLEKENAGHKKMESVSALESSEPFQKKFTEGRTRLVDQLKEQAGYADIPADELAAIANKRGKDKAQATDAILENVGRYNADNIVQTLRAIEALDQERAQEIANAETIMRDRITARETTERRARDEKVKARQEAWEGVLPKAKEYGLSDEKLQEAAEFFKSNKDSGRAADITLKGHAYDGVVSKLATAEAIVAEYEGAKPGVHAGGAQPGSADGLTAEEMKLPLAQRANLMLLRMNQQR